MGLAAVMIGTTAISAGVGLAESAATRSAAKQTAQQNNDTTRQIYGENKATESQFIDPGVAANAAQARLLGLGGGGAAGGNIQGLTGTADAGGVPVHVGPQPPESPTSGVRWIDTSSGSPVLHVYDESSTTWATPGASEQGKWLNGQTLQGVLASVSAPAPGGSKVDPALTDFAQRVGTAPQIDAVRNTIGSSLPEYLDNTGQAGPTKQIEDQLGGNFQEYLDRSGVGPQLAQSEDFLGVGANGGGIDAFRRNTGVDQTDKARADLLGVGGTGGVDTFAQNAGFKGSNDAIEKFLGIGAGGLGDFLSSTGYNFLLDTGSKAIDRSAATKGLLRSGSTAKGLTQYGQDLAKSFGTTYVNALGAYGAQRASQAQQYADEIAALEANREGVGIDFANQSGAAIARRQGLSVDRTNALASLGNIKRQQALDFTGQQSGLADLNRSNFTTLFGAQGDVANRGATAANALAGVGTSAASQLAQNNNNALAAQAGANANVANTINSSLNNALGAYAYLKKPAVSAVDAWSGGPVSSAYGGYFG